MSSIGVLEFLRMKSNLLISKTKKLHRLAISKKIMPIKGVGAKITVLQLSRQMLGIHFVKSLM